jgi:hypothetical protein
MNYLWSAGIMSFTVEYVLKTIKKILLLTTIFIHYTTSSGCALTSVGKQSKNHACGSQEGHEDENRDLSTISKDVLEVPDVAVKLSDERRAWTYGSIGVGVDYGPKIWKEHHHVFSAHAQQTTHVEPSAAVQLGNPNRLRNDILDRHPVDCLLMEGEINNCWISWIREAADNHRPHAIMMFAEGSTIEEEEAGIPKMHRKFMNKLG